MRISKMKITKKQLKKIIKEEKARLKEGRMAEMEMQLIDDLVNFLIDRGAVMDGSVHGSMEQEYADAAEYLRTAVLPHLESV